MSREDRHVSVIVGGSGHIGRAIGQALLDAGHDVILVARGAAGLRDAARNMTPSPRTLSADFTDEYAVAQTLLSLRSEHGRLDSIIYSAGVEPDPDVPLADYPSSAWRVTLDTYATGFFYVLREAFRLLEVGGHIVAIGSAVTRMPGDRLPPGIFVGHYSAAKAALDELCKWARREAHERSLLLSRLAPGAVDVPFHRNAPPHRKPAAVLPLAIIAERVAFALTQGVEVDEQLIATAPEGPQSNQS